MKLGSVTTLTFSFALAVAFSSLRAQDTSTPSSSDVYQCTNWIRATVPVVRGPNDGDSRRLDPDHFCAGLQEGGLSGWGAVYKCGHSTEQSSAVPLRYCASFGGIKANSAWAAGYTSTTKDGGDLLSETSNQAAVTFYTTKPVQMESLRLPAGMYKLIPTRSPDGWRLKVAKHPNQDLGSVELKRVDSDQPSEKSNLAISLNPGAERCPGTSSRRDVRELHLTYGTTDLFVCFRPVL